MCEPNQQPQLLEESAAGPGGLRVTGRMEITQGSEESGPKEARGRRDWPKIADEFGICTSNSFIPTSASSKIADK